MNRSHEIAVPIFFENIFFCNEILTDILLSTCVKN